MRVILAETMLSVIISTPEHLHAVRKRLGEDPGIAVFADTNSIKALELIQRTRPRIVALNQPFARTGRVAALVAQLRTDPHLSGAHVCVLIEDENEAPLLLADTTASPEKALLKASRPLERVGTRAALRYVMDRRAIMVNG